MKKDAVDAMIKQVSKDLDDDVNKSIMDMLLKDVNNAMCIPSNILTSSSYTSSSVTNPPWFMPSSMPDTSVTRKYPIKNGAWWKYSFQNKLYDVQLEAAFHAIPSLVKYFHNISMLNGEVFMAKLEDTRSNRTKEKTEVHPILLMGHTYDPWWRSISEHKSNHYTKISDREVGFCCDTEFQISVHSLSEEVLIFWGFNSSIDKTPIYLFLYTFAKFDYADKRKKNNHLTAIHPYYCSTSSNYDLTRQIDYTPATSTGSFSTSKWIDNLNKADDVDLWSPNH